MANESVAEVSFDLSLDTSGIKAKVSEASKKITDDFNKSFKEAIKSSKAFEKTTEQTGKIITEASEEVKENIKSILSDTEKSAKSKAASIASVYRKEGIDGSEALKKAWADVNESVGNRSKKTYSSVTSGLFGSFKNVFRKIKKDANDNLQSVSQNIVKSFISSAANIKAAFDMVLSVIRTLISKIGELMSAYQKQIEAESKLAVTMRNSTGATKKQIESVKKLASELQALGVIGDEIQLAGAQELSTYVSTTESIKKMLPVLNDMVAQQYGYNATAESSVTIATMLGKVLQGQTSALSRYGYSFDKAQEKLLKYGTEEQKVATLASVVSASVGGVNNALANTSTGKIKQLSNDFGDLKEHLGNLVTNILAPLAKWLDTIVVKLNASLEKTNQIVRNLLNIQEIVDGVGMNNLSEGAADTSDSLSDAAKAAEKLKKTVAGFDQLNILSSDSSTQDSAEGGSDAGAALQMPDVTPAEKQTDNLKKKLETVFGTIKKIAKFTGITKLLDNIRREVKKIDFSAITDNFRTAAVSLLPIGEQSLKSVLTIFRSYMGYIGALIGGTARTVSGVLQTVSGGVAQWLSTDNQKIAGFIADISGNVSGGINNITSFIQGFTDTLNGSFDRMRDRVQNSIADLLSGATTLVGSVGTILSAGFLTATSELNSWIDENGEALGNYYDNIQTVFSDAMSFVGEVFSDVGDTMLGWWNTGGGKEMWESFCGIVGDLGALFLKVFNQNIMPVWNTFVGMLRNAWQQHIQPILSKAMTTVSKLWNEILSPFWDNFLKPFLSWFADKFSARIQRQLKIVQDVFATVTGALGGYINAWLDKLNAVIDFVSAVFAGDWKKAWQAVQDYFKAEWDGIYSIAKGAINLIIDALNMLWTNIYDVAASIVDTLGGVSGAVSKVFGQDLSFSLPASIPTIPHLAAGGLVSAPTLALVGDNKGAATDPEVVAPLSKLQGLLGQTSDPQIIAMLNRIITLLENEESVYQNNFYLDSERIESKLVKVRRRKSRRYGGVTA